MNTIHFIGYSAVHPSDFQFEAVTAPGQYTLLLVTTPVQFLSGGQWLEYPGGTAMLYAPGQAICYRACRDTYQNDWMRFTSDDPLVTQFPLTGVPFPVSDMAYCHNLLKLLTWEASLASADSDPIISNLLQALFLRLRRDTARRETSAHTPRLLNLHKKIYNSPHLPWNIRSMADELHLSAGYLQILYKKTFGVSCMDDVITSRIRMAREQSGLPPSAFRRGASARLPGTAGTDRVPPHTPAKKTSPEDSREDVSFADPSKSASLFGLPHYNVAGSDLPSDVLDSQGNILPPQTPEL